MNKKQRNKRDGLGQPGNYLCQVAAVLLTFSLHPLGFSFSFSGSSQQKPFQVHPLKWFAKFLWMSIKEVMLKANPPFFFLIEMG